MKHWQRKISALGLLAGLSLSAAVPTGRIVATGVGVAVHESELESAYRRYVMTQATLGVNVSPLAEKAIQKRLLSDLIVQRLLDRRAQAGDRAKAELEAGKKYTELKNSFLTDDAFRLHLESNGMSSADFLKQLRVELLADTVARRELHSKVQAKESELLKFYNDRNAKSQWNVPEQAMVAEVFISLVDPATNLRLNPDARAKKQATATKVFGQASVGIEFKQLVKEFSENPLTKQTDGEFLLVAGQGEPKVEKAVFALKVNQISQPLESKVGFHIVKMLEHKAARTKGFAEVRNDIREFLQAEAYGKELPDYFKQLKKESEVRILVANLAD
jgi:parvulin-like peptidyl-prolyl isomerase